MSDSRFKEGDAVQLKSGGPIMTVIASNENGAKCTWWSHTKEEYGERVFPHSALRQTEPQSSSGTYV